MSINFEYFSKTANFVDFRHELSIARLDNLWALR